MKKIREFFKKQKKRFVSWYSNTLYPVKRVILLLTLCFIVAFGLGSCSVKKSYKQASAASTSNVIDITTNFQAQLYINNGNTTLCKLLPDFSFRIADNTLYYWRDRFIDILDVKNTTVPTYYYYEDGSKFSYTGAELSVTVSVSNVNVFSDILTSKKKITNISVLNEVNSSKNYVRYNFYDNSSLLFYVDFRRVPLPGSGFNVSLKSSDYPWYKFYISYGDRSLNQYNLGYNYGYEVGYNKGLSETLPDIEPWQVIVDGLDSFMNIKLFGSISLGTVLKIGLAMLLVGLVIKIFLGG